MKLHLLLIEIERTFPEGSLARTLVAYIRQLEHDISILEELLENARKSDS
jgi:hypothetical protein